mgnify:CR=1 FL=1|tara:strand:+ start:3303 stop:3650 length:348 start_codon:yes stop_codon:yes gene_type:complete
MSETLTEYNQLATFLRKKPNTLIQFSATWCGPCERITPLVRDIFTKLPTDTRSQHIYIDIDAFPKIAKIFKVNAIPHFRVYNRDTNSTNKPLINGALQAVTEYCTQQGIDLTSIL